MNQYFLQPYEPFGGDISFKVYLFNYATKTDLKNTTGIDTSKRAVKSDLVNLKAEADKLEIDKLLAIPVDLSNLNDALKMVLLKKLGMIN